MLIISVFIFMLTYVIAYDNIILTVTYTVAENQNESGNCTMTNKYENSNVDAFLTQQTSLNSSELKRLFRLTENIANEYDNINHNEIAEYFKCQNDMIMNELLSRFDNDLERMLSFLN
jgi:hypothetical protein